MKELVQATVAIVIACALLFFAVDRMQSTGSAGNKDTLTVYNWGEYIDPS